MYFTRHTLHLPTRSAFMLPSAVLALFLFSSVLSPAHAEPAKSHTGFSYHLETPPAFTPQTGTEEDQPDCTVPDNNRTRPMVCSISARQNPTRSASIKNGYLDNTDLVPMPGQDNIGRKMGKTLADPKKSEYDWGVEVELRDSPVLEDTGNAQRNEGKGALIKGNIRF
ncbi:hypothetical protein NB640_10200 [Oxalobacter vibrioformis]|uniref:Uncharacterized protein n=1 Tax=Oxalobacter vibrioformis TaxID=933080 RepID=A0A9E9LY69_9BURK|nr:hypothetical protein [Oxalobacter vibrioformis]WAW09594.1 hypothetical protein NB640_10200 [Oxalobacter vibrioformis]